METTVKSMIRSRPFEDGCKHLDLYLVCEVSRKRGKFYASSFYFAVLVIRWKKKNKFRAVRDSDSSEKEICLNHREDLLSDKKKLIS